MIIIIAAPIVAATVANYLVECYDENNLDACKGCVINPVLRERGSGILF